MFVKNITGRNLPDYTAVGYRMDDSARVVCDR